MEQIRYPRKLDSKINNFNEGNVARKHLQKLRNRHSKEVRKTVRECLLCSMKEKCKGELLFRGKWTEEPLTQVMGSDMTEGMVECWPFLLIKIRPRSFLKVECESERVRWPFCFVFLEPSRTFLYRSGQPSGGTKLSHEAILW